jgi:hypothetical protein
MKGDKKDVGFFEDAILYLQNAIALENHAIESYSSTKDKQFLDIAFFVRRKRSVILNMITKESKGQIYCINKHALACAMALKELASRFSEEGDNKMAEECINDATSFEAIVLMLNQEVKK